MKINKKYLAASFAAGLCFVLFVMAVCHKSNTMKEMTALQNQRTETVLKNLNRLNEELLEAKSGPQRKQSEALQHIEADLHLLQKSIVEIAKTSDIQKVSHELLSVKNDIGLQIDGLKQAVLESKTEKNYLNANALPFHVIAVDVIAGRSYVSVDYGHQIMPLGIGDLLAGWRLNNADHGEGKAEFVNDKNQFVLVALQGA